MLRNRRCQVSGVRNVTGISRPTPDFLGARMKNGIVDEIQKLFVKHGGSLYGGEAVTQLEHALQAASLAEAEGASPALISAALLHDIGHLMHDLPDDAPDAGIDDIHER